MHTQINLTLSVPTYIYTPTYTKRYKNLELHCNISILNNIAKYKKGNVYLLSDVDQLTEHKVYK